MTKLTTKSLKVWVKQHSFNSTGLKFVLHTPGWNSTSRTRMKWRWTTPWTFTTNFTWKCPTKSTTWTWSTSRMWVPSYSLSRTPSSPSPDSTIPTSLSSLLLGSVLNFLSRTASRSQGGLLFTAVTVRNIIISWRVMKISGRMKESCSYSVWLIDCLIIIKSLKKKKYFCRGMLLFLCLMMLVS